MQLLNKDDNKWVLREKYRLFVMRLKKTGNSFPGSMSWTEI
jgi:hypothetical protein